jgi:TPR repeat protein
VGGLIAIGFPSDLHLFILSWNGRGLFDLRTYERTARDYDDPAGKDWVAADQLSASGIGEPAPAQDNLGLMYVNGRGVWQDYAIAVSWFRKAPDQGYAPAQHNLGVIYLNGQGVSQDYGTAVSWFQKAADQGYAPAQSNLGVMYVNGWGVPQDYVAAHMWFNLAAAGGLKSAPTNRELVAAKMTPQQIAEAERRFAKWQRSGPNP